MRPNKPTFYVMFTNIMFPSGPVMRPSDAWLPPLLEEYRRLAKLPTPPVKIEQDQESDEHFRCTQMVQSPIFDYCYSGSDYAGLVATVDWLKRGPKIVNVTEEQWQALSRVEIRLSLKDFSMPYPSLLVNMPPGHMHRYVILSTNKIDCETSGLPVLIGCSMSHSHVHDIVTTVRDRGGRPIEEALCKFHNGVEQEEADEATLSLRVACNMALAMANYGCISQYAFPKEVEAEKKYIKKGNRAGRDGRTASDRLAEQPIILTLNREVKLFHRKTTAGHGETTGKEMPFHWRKGHWHTVLCGVGKTERKQVLYPPTMVRADLFVGDVMDTNTIYK